MLAARRRNRIHLITSMATKRRSCQLRSRDVPRPGVASAALLLIDPQPGDGRRAIPDGAAQDAAGHISQVWLEGHERGALRPPHAQHLGVLPAHDPPGDPALLGPLWRLPEPP